MAVNLLQNLLVIGHLLTGLLDKFDDALDLPVGHKAALNTGRF